MSGVTMKGVISWHTPPAAACRGACPPVQGSNETRHRAPHRAAAGGAPQGTQPATPTPAGIDGPPLPHLAAAGGSAQGHLMTTASLGPVIQASAAGSAPMQPKRRPTLRQQAVLHRELVLQRALMILDCHRHLREGRGVGRAWGGRGARDMRSGSCTTGCFRCNGSCIFRWLGSGRRMHACCPHQEVVVVQLPLVLARHNHGRLVPRLLPMSKARCEEC